MPPLFGVVDAKKALNACWGHKRLLLVLVDWIVKGGLLQDSAVGRGSGNLLIVEQITIGLVAFGVRVPVLQGQHSTNLPMTPKTSSTFQHVLPCSKLSPFGMYFK